MRQTIVSLLILLPFFSICAFAADSPRVLRHGGAVQTVKFSPVNNALLASAGDTLKLWDLQQDTVSTLKRPNAQINSIAFSPEGAFLASGGDDRILRLWDVQTQQRIAAFEHIPGDGWGASQITSVVFSPEGLTLASAGYLSIKLWDIHARREIATLQHDDWVQTVGFSPNGEHLATGDAKGSVRVFDIEKRDVIARLQGDTQNVYSVVFSPDGRNLATAGYDGEIKLWRTSDWSLLGTLQNPGTAFTLDFSPDGKALLSTGHEVVTLWSVESGEEITSLTGHSGWVNSAAFSTDGKSVVSGGNDGTVRVQNIESYLQTLQQRESVRLIYFLPLNRSAQHDIDTKLDTRIKDVQQFYAEQMQTHGFGRKTFTFETDATGKVVVHHVNGKFRDAYYDTQTFDKVTEEIEERFSLSTNLYLIFTETGSEKIDVHWCGEGGIHGTTGGKALVPASGNCFVGDFGVDTTAHELGHAFGLDHDFRDDAYMMSYGANPDRLSYCAAEWLNTHRYFNTHDTSFNEPTTLEMLTPLALPHNASRFRFEVADADGLHQAQLIIPVATDDPADGVKLHSCLALDGETSRIEFTTIEVRPGSTTEVTLRVIDVYGNFTYQTYPLRVGDVARVDTDGDGRVDVADLVFVASHFGKTVVRGTHPNPDVNNDGLVNREDLLLVAEVLESEESAPAAPNLTTSNLQRWILEAKRGNPGDETFQKGVRILEQLLTSSYPTETILLANYPNPFNPETWIPYQLSKPADVTLTIYSVNGQVVRKLTLGHQTAGMYQSKSRAVHWDGRNAVGEPVASGIYFYTLTADDFTATRKLLIKK